MLTDFFPPSNIKIETELFTLYGEPQYLAKEVMGFYYACFLLSETEYLDLLSELTIYFRNSSEDSVVTFCMPVNRLLVSIE